jgi:hypothetical protein
MTQEESWFPEQLPCVIIDGEHIPTCNIEVLNVEEDVSGRDLLTFSWKGEQRQSFVVLKYV